MAKAKIKLNRNECIGCGSCSAICPKLFEMIDDGKAHIVGVDKKEIDELEVEKLECSEAAAEVCPVQCIHIEK